MQAERLHEPIQRLVTFPPVLLDGGKRQGRRRPSAAAAGRRRRWLFSHPEIRFA